MEFKILSNFKETKCTSSAHIYTINIVESFCDLRVYDSSHVYCFAQFSAHWGNIGNKSEAGTMPYSYFQWLCLNYPQQVIPAQIKTYNAPLYEKNI